MIFFLDSFAYTRALPLRTTVTLIVIIILERSLRRREGLKIFEFICTNNLSFTSIILFVARQLYLTKKLPLLLLTLLKK